MLYYGQEENHLIVDKVPNSFKKEFIGNGCTGICYLTEDNKVFKELQNDVVDPFVLKALTFTRNEDFAFPETIIYKNNKSDSNIIGYLMPYFEGNTLIVKDGSIETFDIINACEKSEKEIKNLSLEDGILLRDLNPTNVLFDKNTYKFVDADLSRYYPDEEPYYIHRENMKEWGNLIMDMYVKNYPFNNNRLNELYLNCIFDGKVRPSIILYGLFKEIEKMGYANKTLDDFEKGLSLIKRK